VVAVAVVVVVHIVVDHIAGHIAPTAILDDGGDVVHMRMLKVVYIGMEEPQLFDHQEEDQMATPIEGTEF